MPSKSRPPKEKANPDPILDKKDSLIYKASKAIAKKSQTNNLKGEIPEDMREKVEYRINKKAYDRANKAEVMFKETTQLRKKGVIRERYKEKRKEYVNNPDNKKALNLALKTYKK